MTIKQLDKSALTNEVQVLFGEEHRKYQLCTFYEFQIINLMNAALLFDIFNSLEAGYIKELDPLYFIMHSLY